MFETYTHILGIAPYEGMHTAMKNAAQAYPNLQLDVYTGDLDEGVSIVQSIPPNTYDCIISRGGTAELIRKVTDIPVVEIHLSVYDVLRSMKLAENYSSRYAIVGFSGITGPAHTLCDLLGHNLEIVTIHKASEVHDALLMVQQKGYHMIICDNVAHIAARSMGLDAFLITSGAESLHAALDQAMDVSLWFGRMRQENMILRSITKEQNGRAVVMDISGKIHYSSPVEPSDELAKALKSHLKEIPTNGTAKFYCMEHDHLCSIHSQPLQIDVKKYYLFYCVQSKIPLHTNMLGIRFMNEAECQYLFMNSFYSLSGAMGTLSSEIHSLAGVRQPIMISGEPGTGKEQIARYLYLHSSLSNKPFILVNCELMNDKSWDFLLNHYNSPLNTTGNTIYFQNLECVSETHASRLIADIQETGLRRRVRLIFSCVCYEEIALPDTMRQFIARLGCLTLNLPPLRTRSDEIPSLASLYLNSLNLELGKQISGFEPRAIEMLRQYSWPSNNIQFKHILQSLAAITDSTYIRSSAVAELLAKERFIRHAPAASAPSMDTNRRLDEIIQDIVEKVVADNNGNRAAAARQLDISRTTLWRYLGKKEE